MDILISLAVALFILGTLIGLWLLFEKAGEKGWKAIIPFYNILVLLKIVGRPWHWLLYMLIPVIGQVISIGVIADLLKSFGKEKFTNIVLGVLFPFIYLPYLGMQQDVKYVGPATEVQGKKSTRQEWIEAIGFAVIAATLIRWLIMEAYTIPTPSMENSLLVGDFLFVSKFHYGTRSTTTPLQVPLTHQKIWFTEIPSYVEWVKLPQYRLPGFSEVKREDVVVFNIPPKALSDYKDYPVDLKTNYIKRCVGIPGDVLTVRDGEVFANGQPLSKPPEMQFGYQVHSNDEIHKRNFDRLDLGPEDFQGNRLRDGSMLYYMFLTAQRAEAIKSLPFVKSVELNRVNDGQDLMPYSQYLPGANDNAPRQYRWSLDNFGPLWVPKKGETIQINDSTLALYGATIKLYDLNDEVSIDGGKLIIDGKEVKEYTFKQNYYFMMGDNRHNSLDSRYWGFVPEDHIVGKAFFIWLSLDNNASFFKKIRWSRFFKMIE